jgi:hypothetical protein
MDAAPGMCREQTAAKSTGRGCGTCRRFTSDVQTPRLGENAKPYAMAILRFQIDGHMLLSASHEDFQVRISFLAFARASAHTVVW